MAQSRDTSPGMLHRLASDAEFAIRFQVALNPNTPAVALELLAHDAHAGVRQHVAAHEYTPSAVLGELARDEVSYVRATVAENLRTPGSIVAALAGDPEKRVRDVARRTLVARGQCLPKGSRAAASKATVKELLQLDGWRGIRQEARDATRALLVAFAQPLFVTSAKPSRNALETAVRHVVAELNRVDARWREFATVEREDLTELIVAIASLARVTDSATVEGWIDDEREW